MTCLLTQIPTSLQYHYNRESVDDILLRQYMLRKYSFFLENVGLLRQYHMLLDLAPNPQIWAHQYRYYLLDTAKIAAGENVAL